jgi:hypothetical protein
MVAVRWYLPVRATSSRSTSRRCTFRAGARHQRQVPQHMGQDVLDRHHRRGWGRGVGRADNLGISRHVPHGGLVRVPSQAMAEEVTGHGRCTCRVLFGLGLTLLPRSRCWCWPVLHSGPLAAIGNVSLNGVGFPIVGLSLRLPTPTP